MDKLVNTVRPYAWGSVTALPALLGQEPTGEPQAELWMGAHPGDPSRADRGEGPRRLDELIAADPEGELGAASVARFGPTLPFLLKVLAPAIPISIQAHPSLDQARAGFAAENALGIPWTPRTGTTGTPTTSPNSSAPWATSTACAASAGPPTRPRCWPVSASPHWSR